VQVERREEERKPGLGNAGGRAAQVLRERLQALGGRQLVRERLQRRGKG
jgi:hypothetical protein